MAQRPTLFICMLAATVALLSSSIAYGQSANLVKYSSPDSKILIGLNMSGLRGTPAFREVLTLAKKDARLSQAMQILENEAGLDLEKDIDAAVFAMPEPAPTPEAAKGNDTIVVILRGKFDQDRLVNSVKNRADAFETITNKGEVTRYVSGRASVGFADAKHLIFTFGEPAFSQSTWAAVNGGKSADKQKLVKQLTSQINTKRGVWVIGITENLPQQGPKMKSAGLTLDVRKGLKVQMTGNMLNAKDAKAAVKDFDKIKGEAANPMVGMLGATPLVSNLKVSSKKSVVSMTTKMSETEFGAFRANLRNILMQGSQPAPTMGQPTMGQPPNGATGPATADPAKKGAAADFN